MIQLLRRVVIVKAYEMSASCFVATRACVNIDGNQGLRGPASG
jgi:hypothetical protein